MCKVECLRTPAASWYASLRLLDMWLFSKGLEAEVLEADFMTSLKEAFPLLDFKNRACRFNAAKLHSS
jgi:hypothetical protein